MSAVFNADSFAGDTWLASGSSDSSVISPFDESFPKRETFEDVDLSKLPPVSLLSDDASGLDTLAFDGHSFHPQQPLMTAGYQPACRNNSWPVYNEQPSVEERKMSYPHASMVQEQQQYAPDSKRPCPTTPSSSRKRKSVGSGTETSSRSSASPPPPSMATTTPSSQPRKTTHNMIEKRYRTNLNDKIAALRDAVPSLRIMVHRLGREGKGLDDAELAVETESLGGLAPAHKLSKATVLSKATEYIAHLERSNEALVRENNHLRSRAVGLEMMMMSRNQGYAGVWG